MRKRAISIAKNSRAVQRVGRILDAVIPAPAHICTVLTFHRIDTHEPELYPGLAGLDAASFEAFVDELADRFHPIGIDEFVGALSNGYQLPRRPVLVTFDDGYRDFAEIAWPTMRDRGVPVVLFVPTAYPDDPKRRFWWDELYSALASTGPREWGRAGIDGTTPDGAFRSVRDEIKSMPHDDAVAAVRAMVTELTGPAGAQADPSVERVLRWAELEKLASEGVALAPHSRTHPMLDQLPPDRLDDEIRGSLEEMYERLGHDRVKPVFAYPAGGHDPRVRDAVMRAGIEAAFTTERGLVDLERSDHLRLPRLNVGRSSSVGIISAEAAIRRVPALRRSARWGRLG